MPHPADLIHLPQDFSLPHLPVFEIRAMCPEPSDLMRRAFNRSASFFRSVRGHLPSPLLPHSSRRRRRVWLGFGSGGCVLQIDDFILVSSVLSSQYSLSILPSCLLFVSSLGLVSVLLNFVDDFWLGRFFDSLFVV